MKTIAQILVEIQAAVDSAAAAKLEARTLAEAEGPRPLARGAALTPLWAAEKMASRAWSNQCARQVAFAGMTNNVDYTMFPVGKKEFSIEELGHQFVGAIKGDTHPHRQALSELGAVWNKRFKRWELDEKAAANFLAGPIENLELVSFEAISEMGTNGGADGMEWWARV